MSFYLRLVFLTFISVMLYSSAAQEQPRGRELNFPYYYFFAGRRLMNHTIKTLHVKSLDDCEYLCYLEDACVSLNIKNPDSNGMQECELNKATHMEHDKDLVNNTIYWYRGAVNNCGNKGQPLCQNNSTCQSGFTDKGYRCACAPGFKGEHCEIDINECSSAPCLNGATCVDQINGYFCNCQAGYTGVVCENENWINMEPSTVCFGAKDNSYGPFKTPTSGSIITFKLTYQSGSVSCGPRYYSKWGCGHPFVTSHPLGTHITDSNRSRLLPKDEYLKGGSNCLRHYYKLPWATPNSPELLFDNFSVPLAVRADQEFQIWFTEDLNDCDSDNGPDKTCSEVYGLYV